MAFTALLIWQLCCLVTISAGWGAWIWAAGGRPDVRRGAGWVWCGLAGFAAHALVLQGLVYLNQPLACTAWIGFGAAVAGIIFAARQAAAQVWPSRSERREVWLLMAVFLAVVGAQSVVLIGVGDGNYFGRGRHDQANYVVTAQFLTRSPFSTTVQDVGLHPWMVRALEAKEQRITQSVAHGALAVVTGVDAQRAYGMMSAFFMGLIGLSVAAWLRGFSIPRSVAAMGGLAAGLMPAVTMLQAEGYFSQVSTLFVPVALAALASSPAPLSRWHRIGAGVLLAYWIGAYTEVAVIGAGMVVSLRLVAAGRLRDRVADMGWIALASVFLNSGYIVRALTFLGEQLNRSSDPNLLAALFPESGTWLGWGRMFFDLDSGPFANGAMVIVGALVLAFTCVACVMPGDVGWRIRATIAAPAAVLAWLALQPTLPKYPFGKLLAGFAPLALATAVLGMAALRGMRPGVRYGLLMLMVAGGAMNMLREHAESIRGGGRLADLNSPEMRSMREDVRRHPERTYLVANDDPLIAQWLCYFARGSKVYVDRWHLGDRMVASEQFNFRRLPDRATELWWLDPQRRGRVADFWPAAALHIRGAVEEGQVASGRYYVVSDDLHVDIDRATSGSLEQQLWLDLVAVPLPEMTPLEFELIGPDQRRQPTTLLGPTRVRFHLVLSAGTNAFILRAGPAAAGAVGGRVIVQALSLNPLTQRSPASDPVPVSFASTVEARAGR